MDLYLQFGAGMMAHTEKLLALWNGDASVVISPRDLKLDQMIRVGASTLKASGEPLIDPQCYVHSSDHHRLIRHEYWEVFRKNSTGALLGGAGIAEILDKLVTLGTSVGCHRHILPGLLADPVDDDWFCLQEAIIGEAPNHCDEAATVATIALSEGTMLDEDQIEAVIERAHRWRVSAFYVVAETPGPYLVDDPNWLANLLILTAGLKLLGKEVIVGYCNHQSLCLASANVDAIASGTWLNVRAFPPEKFNDPDPDAVSRRAKGGWYYCPQALSEYTMPYLDIAQRLGVLADMQATPSSGFEGSLFTGARPSSVNWGEQNAFRHYLSCLRQQARAARKDTFDDTVSAYNADVDSAETLLARLRGHGVHGQARDFLDRCNASRTALLVLQKTLGPRMRRAW